jgi:hypothetical protein
MAVFFVDHNTVLRSDRQWAFFTAIIASLSTIYCASDLKKKTTLTVYKNITQYNNQQKHRHDSVTNSNMLSIWPIISPKSQHDNMHIFSHITSLSFFFFFSNVTFRYTATVLFYLRSDGQHIIFGDALMALLFGWLLYCVTFW